MVLQPAFVPGFSASIDYWRLRISNGISIPATSPQSVLDQCTLSGGTSPVCALVVRPFPNSNTTPANFPSSVLLNQINVAGEFVQGADFEFSQHIDMSSAGLLDIRLLASYIPTRTWQLTPTSAPLSFAGAANGPATTNATSAFPAFPKLPMTLQFDYNIRHLDVFLQERYISKLNANWQPGQIYAVSNFSPVYYTDMTVTYKLDGIKGRLGRFTNNGDVFLNVNNLMNRQPPTVANNVVSPGVYVPTDNSVYDVIGRYITLGVKFQF